MNCDKRAVMDAERRRLHPKFPRHDSTARDHMPIVSNESTVRHLTLLPR
jgi:hypothetical protein